MQDIIALSVFILSIAGPFHVPNKCACMTI
uniref:Predicted protein n=1 Tax=Hordeum vulgare subsp. vulgare TaxID=112509 RepID=F2E083_HORVV|nr:predicted protein [Hordeum vulgare subsp. vulgare]